EKLHELHGRIVDDPVRPPAFDDREARLWLDRPCVRPDGYFIARAGDAYIGMCDVHVCNTAPGQAQHGMTGVIPGHRRRGIATALKRAAIHYARAQGFQSLRAVNRHTQTELIALNEKLGFTRRYSSVTLERCLRDVVPVDPALLDAYAGHY